MSTDPSKLWAQALASPNDASLLEQVAEHAESIIAWLESPECHWSDKSQTYAEAHADWLATLYDALAGDDALTDDDQATLTAMSEQQERSEDGIGGVFRHILMPNLPPEVANLEHYFGHLPAVQDHDELAWLYEQPSVQSALPEANPLVVRGLTPLDVVEACNAVTLVLNRLGRNGVVDVRGGVVIEARDGDVWPTFEVDSSTVLSHEIAAAAEIDLDAGHALLHWLVDVAQTVPFVFRDYEAEYVRHGQIVLRASDSHDPELDKRWSKQLQPLEPARMGPVLSAASYAH